MRIRPLWFLSLALVASLMAAASGPAIASAPTPPPTQASESTPDPMSEVRARDLEKAIAQGSPQVDASPLTAAQVQHGEKFDPLAGRISELAGSAEGWRPGAKRLAQGYLQLVIADDAIDLYWKGAVPAAVRDAIAAEPSVKVNVHQVSYDEDEFLGAQDDIMQELESTLPSNLYVELIDHELDRSGFIVHIAEKSVGTAPGDELRAEPSGKSKMTPTIQRQIAATVKRQIARLTSIPAKVSVSSTPVNTPLWRNSHPSCAD